MPCEVGDTGLCVYKRLPQSVSRLEPLPGPFRDKESLGKHPVRPSTFTPHTLSGFLARSLTSIDQTLSKLVQSKEEPGPYPVSALSLHVVSFCGRYASVPGRTGS